MKSILYLLRAKGHGKAIAAITPLLVAVIAIQYPPPLLDLFINGDTHVFLYNMCVLLLIPYFVIFVLALGEMYLSLLKTGDTHPLNKTDIRLISFFAGVGLLTILGFLLGLLGLLYLWVCFLIFICVIYIYFLKSGAQQLAPEFARWISADKYTGSVKITLIILRSILITTVAAVLLSKGILLELFKDGGLHQYFSYFAETRLNHSTWMDPSHPVMYDYLAGRGQGVYLFLTSFTNQFTIQIISSIYLIAIGVVSRQVISFLLSAIEKKQGETSFCIFLPDLVLLLVICSPLLQMEPARFHLQTGAFFLFLAWTTPLLFLFDRKRARWLFLSQIPILIAFPITGGIYLGFIAFVFGMEIFSLLLTRNRALLRFPFLSIVIATVSGILSFSLNWLYVGIPDLQPAQIFIPLIVQDRFQQWSSRGLIFYLDSSMSSSASLSSFSILKIISNISALFSYPLDILAEKFSFTELNLYTALLPSFYPILMLAVLIWIAVKFLLNNKAKEETTRPIKIFFIYWLTFTSCYIIKILLESFIQQSSLDRMLLFMNVFPIISFFAIILFLTQRDESKLQFMGFKTKDSIMDNNIITELKKKYHSIVTVSILCGGCISLSIINLWSYFWRRSFPIQFWLFVLITIASVNQYYLFLRIKSHYLHTLTKNKRRCLFVIVSIISMLLFIILSPFISFFPHIPVTHTIKITALDNKNPISNSNEVKLIEMKINGEIFPLESFGQSGNWLNEKEALWIRGHVPLAIDFTAKSDSIVEILFKKSPSGGLVQIEFDNQEPIVKNLFSGKVGIRIASTTLSLADKYSLLFTVFSVVKYFAIFGLIYVVPIQYLKLKFIRLALAFWDKFTRLVLVFWDKYFSKNIWQNLNSPDHQGNFPIILRIIELRTVIFGSSIIFFGLIFAFYQFQINFGFDKIIGGMEYFSGKKGAVEAYGPVTTYGEGTGDRSDIFTCLEILNKVPGLAPVLNLNGFAAVEPCLFSPLLPRDKIVHHYESVTITEPYYLTLMYGEPETAYAVYRKLGINHFYIRKNDLLFVNLGYSLALIPQNLEQYFDVYAESNDFYVLTWRGQGLYPVSYEIRQKISEWYEGSKNPVKNPIGWWGGKVALDGWVQLHNTK